MSQQFSTAPDYLESIRGLRRLHELALSGQDEGPEGESVRESLELPWRSLSDAERKRINGLSEDFYSLSNPPGQSSASANEQDLELRDTLTAYRNGEWDLALESLRRSEERIDLALVAYLRGVIWMKGGDYDTSALFLGRAAELRPENSAYASLYVHVLDQSNPAAAQARVSAILADVLAIPTGAVSAAS